MNSMKQIKSIINEDGSITMEGHGFVGPECDKCMKVLEEALGKSTMKIKKPEYFQKDIRKQKVGA